MSFPVIPVVLDNEILSAWSCWEAFWQESPLVLVVVLTFSVSLYHGSRQPGYIFRSGESVHPPVKRVYNLSLSLFFEGLAGVQACATRQDSYPIGASWRETGRRNGSRCRHATRKDNKQRKKHDDWTGQANGETGKNGQKKQLGKNEITRNPK